MRVQAVYPPDIADLSPLDPAWNTPRPANSPVTNRDVIDTVLFALSRPRHVTLGTIIFDPDTGGIH